MLLISATLVWATALADGGNQAFTISYANRLLSVNIKDAPLDEVLAELARQARARIFYTGPRSKQKIRAQFEALTLEQGIKQIIGQNYLLIYKSPANVGKDGALAEPRLAEIRILSRKADDQMTQQTGRSAPRRAMTNRKRAPTRRQIPE